MKRCGLLAVLALAWPYAAARAQTPADLTVCLQQNDPPLSWRAGGKASGFALALSELVAQRLGRGLHVQWFVSRDDADTSLVKDTHALLSDGRCQLVAEYPLTQGTLETPRSPTVKLPPFDGAKPDDRTRWVKTSPLLATSPYRLEAMAVVVPARDGGRTVATLGDLAIGRIGVQIATLADAVAMRYGAGRLANQVVHFPDGPALFGALQSGQVDAALTDLRSFDAWRLRHGDDGLTVLPYRHSVSFNMAFAGLATDRALIGQVDTVLADLRAHGSLSPLAAEAGLTFTAPEPPDVRPDVGLAALNGD